MGVMNCSRKHCDNLLCDTYIEEVGYICNECMVEFKEKMGVFKYKKSYITKQLVKFMKTAKDDRDEFINVDKFFK